MKERFMNLWTKLNAKGNPEEKYYDLVIKYSEKHRLYHNLSHIENCLNEFNDASHLARQPDLVELAIWYHDMIYDTKEKNNEDQSALLAYGICIGAGLSKVDARKVLDLILATKHNISPLTNDTKLIVDIDLSILGKPQEEFEKYEANIKREYSLISEDEFREGRTKVLEEFLKKAKNNYLYSTDFFKNKYKNQAKINIYSALEKLHANP